MTCLLNKYTIFAYFIKISVKNLSCEFGKSIMHFCYVHMYTFNKQ